MVRDFYLILGIAESAPEDEIRKAYRRLARRHHPDINPGDREAEELFKQISDAYAVLSNPEKRQFYDQHGYYSEGVLEAPEPRWDFSFRSEDAGPGSFGDVLDSFFAGEPAELTSEPEDDVEARVSLTFEESLRGLMTDVEVERKRRCNVCLGTGVADRRPDQDCSRCQGTGRHTRAHGHLRFSTACGACRGSGRVRAVCPDCRGEGRVCRRERVRVDLPAGVSSGTRLRFAGKGHSNPKTGHHGDLFVVTNVATHPIFRRAGDNLYCKVPVTISEAALGAKIPVPTIEGTAMLRVPPGVQPGQTLRLRGGGAPSLRAEGARGDQYVEIQVVVPRAVDERSREILRELARLHPEDPRKELATDAR